jgi:hypothetical protein
MSEWVRLRCGNAEFGSFRGGSGELRVVCRASRCRDPEGITVHIFDVATGEYTNEIEEYREPKELRGLPGVREKRHGADDR